MSRNRKWLTGSHTGDVNYGGNKPTNVGTPSSATDAATKGYVDSQVQGLKVKEAVRLCTAAALPAYTQSGTGVGATLTMDANGALSIDGIAVANGDRVLINNDGTATGADRGIYTQTTLGDVGTQAVLTRATDMDADSEVASSVVHVIAGSTLVGKRFYVESFGGTLDTDAISWAEGAGGTITAGDGISVSGNTVSADLKAGGGLKFDGGELQVEPGDFAGSGLEDDGGDSMRIAAAAAGNGLTGGGGSPLTVQAADTSVNVAGGGVKAAVLIEERFTSAASSGADDFDTGGALTAAPAAGSIVRVSVVGGPELEVGDGVKTKDCYFTADAGTSAESHGSHTAGAELYYNAAVVGVDLSASDVIVMQFSKAG